MKNIVIKLAIVTIAGFFISSCLPEAPPVPKRLELRFVANNVGSSIVTENDTLEITQVKFLIGKFNLITPSNDTLQTQQGVLPVTYDTSTGAEDGVLVVAGNIGFEEYDTFTGYNFFARPLRAEDGVIDNTLLEAGEGYSIAFRGQYNGESFLLRSKAQFEKNYEFSRVSVNEDKETLLIKLITDMNAIFIKDGTLIDPRDENNIEQISTAFEESISLEISSVQSLPFN